MLASVTQRLVRLSNSNVKSQTVIDVLLLGVLMVLELTGNLNARKSELRKPILLERTNCLRAS